MIDKMELRARTVCKVISRRQGKGRFHAVVSLFRLSDGKLLKRFENECTTNLLNKSAKGAATGSFDAINKMQFYELGPTLLATETATKIAGGTGSEDYVIFEATYTNGSGVTKTVDSLKLGYDLGGGGEEIYNTKAAVGEEVLNDDGLNVQWKIVFSYSSGDLTDSYRYKLIAMLASGAFDLPTLMTFWVDSVPLTETATLEAGGTGAEAYHKWTATYNAFSSVTISRVALVPSMPTLYVDSDIVDKNLVNGESLEIHTEITHSAAPIG